MKGYPNPGLKFVPASNKYPQTAFYCNITHRNLLAEVFLKII